MIDTQSFVVSKCLLLYTAVLNPARTWGHDTTKHDTTHDQHDSAISHSSTRGDDIGFLCVFCRFLLSPWWSISRFSVVSSSLMTPSYSQTQLPSSFAPSFQSRCLPVFPWHAFIHLFILACNPKHVISTLLLCISRYVFAVFRSFLVESKAMLKAQMFDLKKRSRSMR